MQQLSTLQLTLFLWAKEWILIMQEVLSTWPGELDKGLVSKAAARVLTGCWLLLLVGRHC